MENRDTLGRVVTCSFKYSVLTRSVRCLKNPQISQIIPFIDRFQSRDYFSIGRHIGAHQM